MLPASELFPFILDTSQVPGVLVSELTLLGHPTREMVEELCPTLTTPSPGPPTVVFVNRKPFAALLWVFSTQVLCILHELDPHIV